jgi:hypothetical protein
MYVCMYVYVCVCMYTQKQAVGSVTEPVQFSSHYQTLFSFVFPLPTVWSKEFLYDISRVSYFSIRFTQHIIFIYVISLVWMGRACSMHGKDDKCVQNSGRET